MNTFKEDFKLGFSIIITNLCCSLGCFFLALMFSGLVVKKWGSIIYTFIAVILIFDLIYNRCWQAGNRDRRDIKIFNNHLSEGAAPKSADKLKGLKAGLICSLFGLVFVVFFAVGKNIGGSVKIISNIILRFWNAPYLVLLGMDGNTDILPAVIISFLPVIYAAFGYITGIKGKNYVEDAVYKLIYKNRFQKKGGKR